MGNSNNKAIIIILTVLISFLCFACACFLFIFINNPDKNNAIENVPLPNADINHNKHTPSGALTDNKIEIELNQSPEVQNEAEENFNYSVDKDEETIKKPVGKNLEKEKKQTLEITPFRFAVSGDSSPMTKTAPQTQVFKKILNQIKAAQPDFYISTGDVIHGHTLDKKVMKTQIDGFLDAVSVLNCDFFVAPGDNDLTTAKQKAYYKELVNNNREFHFYFEHNGLYFVVLSSLRVSKEELDHQFLWLEELLKGLKNQKVFIFIHKPVYSYMYPETDKENKELADLIYKYKVDAVFSGHEHLFYKKQIEDTVFIISGCSGSMPYVPAEEGGFYHYLIINVDKSSWTYQVFKSDGKLYSEETVEFN